MKSKYLAIIIDGYNFLKTTGMMADNVEGIELEKGRRRLLSFLASQFPNPTHSGPQKPQRGNIKDRDIREKKETNSTIPKLTVVFDSQTKMRLPTRLSYKGIDVRFSKGYENADELIIEMIQSFDVPKRLLVVSSDHEIQTAAKRRRAHSIDSDIWLDQLEENAKNDFDSTEEGKIASRKPLPSSTDTEHWLSVFSEVELNESELFDDELLVEDTNDLITPTGDSTPPTKSLDSSPNKDPQDNQREKGLDPGLEKHDLSGFDDIFPPGYGEDLL